jgi:hypothetical protein
MTRRFSSRHRGPPSKRTRLQIALGASVCETEVEPRNGRVPRPFPTLVLAERRRPAGLLESAEMELDDAARGRQAALAVRRSKKQRRQAAVRELEERGVPRMQMRAQLERLGLPASQGTLWNDLKDLGYGQRRPRKHPKPEPRTCEECGATFTPKDASQDARGYGKLCSERCRRRRGGRRATAERHRRADEELARLNAEGYLSTRQAAGELGVAESSLYEILPPAERRLVEGEQLRLVRANDVKALARERLASPWVSYYDDPANYLIHAGKLDVPLDRARSLLDTRQEARRRHRRIRVGTGRPKGTGPPAYHFDWAEAFWQFEAEMQETYESYHVDGDPPPTKWEVAILVAVADYGAHPERWSYSPEQNRRAAADRVWTALKALQSAQSETPA